MPAEKTKTPHVRFSDLPQVRYIPQSERHIPAPILDRDSLSLPTVGRINTLGQNMGVVPPPNLPIVSSATSPLFPVTSHQESIAHSSHSAMSNISQNINNYAEQQQYIQSQEISKPRELKENRETSAAKEPPFSIRETIRGVVRKVMAEEVEHLRMEMKRDIKN